ncbi:MAG: SgcJ/EcaC family oxidoreductase [Vicinamibacterales bacterium]
MLIALAATTAGFMVQQGPRASAPARGARLANLTWVEAAPKLTPQSVVLIAVAPGSSEHGPHLQLRADLALADYFAERVMDATPVVVAPSLTVFHAPGLAEYPGSTTLSIIAARDVVADLIRSLARFGPKRFYIVATGEGAPLALDPAANLLAAEGILLRSAKFSALVDRASRGVRQQTTVGHADEIETSMLLFAAPDVVEMSKAVRDFSPAPAFGRLTRRREGPGIFSESGVWGDATLATRDKGRAIVEAIVSSLVQEVEELRAADPPPVRSTPLEAPRPAPVAAPPARPAMSAGECTAGDERMIAAIGDQFGAAWAARDAGRLGALWTLSGNLVHPDGLVERGSIGIAEARAELFARREYRATRHPIKLPMVRCLAADLAIADGTWELRGLTTTSGTPVPTLEGQCTLVVRRQAQGWLIEAYRYSMKVPTVPVPPNVLKRPGYPGGQ